MKALTQIVKECGENFSEVSRVLLVEHGIQKPSGTLKRYIERPESVNEDTKQLMLSKGIDPTK